MNQLELVALGAAAMDADHRVRETEGNNRGPRIRQYLANVDPPITEAAPWCAAFVQYCADVAARCLGMTNPLDAIRQEAYVQSYWDALAPHQVVDTTDATPGNLVLFSFGGERWDHIGYLAQPVRSKHFWTVEGNTSDANQRDGDMVAVKPRDLDAGYGVAFIRWSE